MRQRTKTLTRAFGLGLTSGAVYFAGTLYWITNVMALYGGLHVATAVLVNALLIAFVALFPALFAVIMRRLIVALGPGVVMAAPFVWVATELGRTHLFSGFPWVLLGYSQVTVLPIAQLSSVAGVYGVSALVVSVSAAAAFSVVTRSTRDRVVALGSVALGVVLIGAWGSLRVTRGEWTSAGQSLKVGLVQGNVDQSQKWNTDRAEAIFQDYLRMTREAIGAGSNLVLWPESSTPFNFEDEPLAGEMVRALARQARVPILLGSDQTERRGAETRYYNAAFLVGADGTTRGVYRKMHLVPFGEYVPLKRILFFAAPLVEAVSDFSSGDRAVLLPLGDHRISTAICYEIVYPALVRQFVLGGSELLTAMTNDAWFGRTSAPYQHFAQAAMRAIEEGRYLVRSANTGISGIVDPYGRVLAETDIFRPAVIVGSVRLISGSTIYARTGDVFAYASTVAALVLLILASRRVK